MAAAALTTVSLKLLINKNAKKVVFAEAEKPFVDFLFFLMSLPLGTVIKLVTQKCMVGALGNLYGSIADLSDTYLQPGTNKDAFLNPKPPNLSVEVPLLMPAPAAAAPVAKKVYFCSGKRNGYGCNQTRSYSDDPNTICSSCKQYMNVEASDITPVKAAEAATSLSKGEGGGFVRAVATYMVMDDLKVMPQSTISTITILNEYNIKNFASLEVKVVHLDVGAGLKLLKAALQTDSVLTNVFLGN